VKSNLASTVPMTFCPIRQAKLVLSRLVDHMIMRHASVRHSTVTHYVLEDIELILDADEAQIQLSDMFSCCQKVSVCLVLHI